MQMQLIKLKFVGYDKNWNMLFVYTDKLTFEDTKDIWK